MASSGNFCTLNPLTQPNAGTFSEGNLLFTHTASAWRSTLGTLGMTTGKWYWEAYQKQYISTGNGWPVGIYDMDSGKFVNSLAGNYPGQSTSTYGATYAVASSSHGEKYHNGSGTSLGFSSSSSGDTWQCAFDADAGKIWFGKNNTWANSGNPSGGSNEAYASIPSSTWAPITCSYNSSNSENYPYNFGQDDTFSGRVTAQGNTDDNGHGVFKYAPPTGFLALCSANLPISADIDPAQTDNNFPQKQFNAVTYTGTGSARSVTGLNFTPDLLWLKCRSIGQSARLIDSNRGVSKTLTPADTQVEGTESNGVTSFDSDGFTIGSSTGGFNTGSATYVAWCWRCNGGTTTSDSSGDITVTRQTNDAAKFSILTYTGSGSSGNTIAHGLGVKPAMTIIKQRNSSNGWNVWHQGYNSGDYDSFGELNSNGSWNANQGSNGPFSAAPGTDYLTLTAYGQVNGSSNTYVAYVWADVEGMQKFGSFEGNSNADGPFIYTGFRPRLVFCKAADATENWQVRDTARSTYNADSQVRIYWNSDAAEGSASTASPIDFLSNGFKVRGSNSEINSNTILYGAWGDVPFKYNNTF